MLIEQPPTLFRRLYPGALWRLDPEEKAVYLTFDDGPCPEVTPWVLEQLRRVDARATFFVVGDNVRKYPDTFRQMLAEGHRVGNHTFNHIKGFSRRYFTSSAYLENTEKAHRIMLATAPPEGLAASPAPDPAEASAAPTSPSIAPREQTRRAIEPLLFRPPHGHMGWGQYFALKKRYQIVMWDVVTRDYSRRLRPPQVLANVMRYTRNGSIITFHDSLKAWQGGNLPYALPRALDFLKEEGYVFRTL